MSRPSIKTAKAQYPHRYTMEHVPLWASKPCENGKYYAPQYRTDQEWYDNTVFWPDKRCDKDNCYSNNQSWPLGEWLDAPYKR